MSAHDEPWREHHAKALEAFSRGEFDEGDAHLRAALREGEQLPRGDSERVKCFVALADAAANLDDLPLAQTWYSRALEETAETFGPDSLPAAEVVTKLGSLALVRGEPAEAEAHALRILALTQKQESLEARTAFVSALLLLADALPPQGRKREAEPLLRRALEVCDSLVPPPFPLLPKVLLKLGIHHRAVGRTLEAEPFVERALLLIRDLGEPDHHLTGHCLGLLGDVADERGDGEQAEKFYREALDHFECRYGDEDPHNAIVLQSLGDVLRDQGRLAEAETLLCRAVTISEEVGPPLRRHLPRCLLSLAFLRREQHHLVEAEDLLRRVLGAPDQEDGDDNWHDSAVALRVLAELCSARGDDAEAEQLLGRALDLHESSSEPPGQELLWVLVQLAALRAEPEDPEPGLAQYRRALAVGEELLGPEHEEVRNLAADFVNFLTAAGRHGEADALARRFPSPDAPPSVAHPTLPTAPADWHALAEEAKRLQNAGLHEQAEAAWRAALHDAQRRRLDLDCLGTCVDHPAALQVDQQRLLGILELCRQVVGHMEAVAGPDYPRLGATLNNLGAVYLRLGWLKESEECFHRALAHGERVHGPRHFATAWANANLGAIYQNSGRLAEAELYLTQALQSWEQQGEAGRHGLIDSLSLLCRVRHSQQRMAEAVGLGRRAFSVCREVYGDAHPRTAEGAQWLASLLMSINQRPEAEQLYRQALAIGEQHPGTFDLVQVLCQLAELARARGAVGESEAFARRGLGLREGAAGCLDVMQMATLLAEMLRERREFDQAEPFYQRAITIAQRLDGPRFINLALVLHNLGLMRHLQGRQPEAAELIEKALEIKEKAGPSAQPHKIIPHKSLGLVYFVMGRRTQADLCFQGFISLAEVTYAHNPPRLAQYLDKLAVLFTNIGRGRDANTLRARAAACRLRPPSP